MQNFSIMAIILDNRSKNAPEVQEVLTKYGDGIISRLGIHDADSNNGIISLNINKDDGFVRDLTNDLLQLEGVQVKTLKVK
ncbi:MAG TPA: hypothetical protein GXZ32_04260 [Clostridiales bacterium]|nr:hypothetical protein [Clostridiales bacterium]